MMYSNEMEDDHTLVHEDLKGANLGRSPTSSLGKVVALSLEIRLTRR